MLSIWGNLLGFPGPLFLKADIGVGTNGTKDIPASAVNLKDNRYLSVPSSILGVLFQKACDSLLPIACPCFTIPGT